MSYDRSKTVGRVAFLAHSNAIRDLLAKGHRNKEVFAELEAELDISYSQFNRYVARYITGSIANGHQSKDVGQIAPPNHTTTRSGTTERQTRGINTQIEPRDQKRPVFKHDPNSGNERDDLI